MSFPDLPGERVDPQVCLGVFRSSSEQAWNFSTTLAPDLRGSHVDGIAEALHDVPVHSLTWRYVILTRSTPHLAETRSRTPNSRWRPGSCDMVCYSQPYRCNRTDSGCGPL